jgi:hypothetical protein
MILLLFDDNDNIKLWLKCKIVFILIICKFFPEFQWVIEVVTVIGVVVVVIMDKLIVKKILDV